jgi:hypothetical protein
LFSLSTPHLFMECNANYENWGEGRRMTLRRVCMGNSEAEDPPETAFVLETAF